MALNKIKLVEEIWEYLHTRLMALNKIKLVEEIWEYLHTWRWPSPPTHKGGGWVNRFVEASRVSPYAAGHLDSFIWPLFILETTYWVVSWLTG